MWLEKWFRIVQFCKVACSAASREGSGVPVSVCLCGCVVCHIFFAALPLWVSSRPVEYSIEGIKSFNASARKCYEIKEESGSN